MTQSDELCISVDDDGSGLPLDSLLDIAAERVDGETITSCKASVNGPAEVIFLQGITTSPALGRGNGLSDVAAAMENIGGGIRVINRQGKGIRITLRLPLFNDG